MFIILQPHSATNPSANHRVVENAAWVAHVDSRGTKRLPVLFEGDYAAAEADCRTRNSGLVTADT